MAEFSLVQLQAPWIFFFFFTSLAFFIYYPPSPQIWRARAIWRGSVGLRTEWTNRDEGDFESQPNSMFIHSMWPLGLSCPKLRHIWIRPAVHRIIHTQTHVKCHHKEGTSTIRKQRKDNSERTSLDFYRCGAAARRRRFPQGSRYLPAACSRELGFATTENGELTLHGNPETSIFQLPVYSVEI